MRIKCCGITRPEDARIAEQEGADAIGVVMFSDSSPRSVSVTVAQDIFQSVGPLITTVVVTHTTSESDLARILEMKPDAIQVSHPFVFQRDPGVRIIRAIRPGIPCRMIAMRSSWTTARAGENTLTGRLPAMRLRDRRCRSFSPVG